MRSKPRVAIESNDELVNNIKNDNSEPPAEGQGLEKDKTGDALVYHFSDILHHTEDVLESVEAVKEKLCKEHKKNPHAERGSKSIKYRRCLLSSDNLHHTKNVLESAEGVEEKLCKEKEKKRTLIQRDGQSLSLSEDQDASLPGPHPIQWLSTLDWCLVLRVCAHVVV